MGRLLTISEAALRRLAGELTAHPDRIRVCRAGTSVVMDRVEWLLDDRGLSHPSDDGSSPRLIVAAAPQVSVFERALARARGFLPGKDSTLLLVLGVGAAAGRISAAGSTPSKALLPLDAVRIVAPGLPYVVLGDGAGPNGRSRAGWSQSPSAIEGCLSAQEIWSRSIGALGEGAWRRITTLHAGIVGCGRMGSLVATSLKRNGVRRLTLVDPDRLEPHNLGEMDTITVHDLGRPKALALAQSLGRQDLGIAQAAETIAETVLSLSALVALKPTDVVFCCVDNPAARLISACIAVLYLKPIIDLGTGIFDAEPLPESTLGQGGAETAPLGPRQMGADVRLILPGRCLLCYGGIAELQHGLAQLLGEGSLQTAESVAHRNWRDQRAGSLRSLNGVAVHLGLRLFEDFVAGRLAASTWLRVEFSQQGIPSIEHRDPQRPVACPLCSLTGHGDEGLGELHGLLQSLQAL